MQRVDWLDRFDARAVTWSLRLYGLALVVDVATEVASGVWNVHAGLLYPWRHLGVLPLYSPAVLAVEWTLRVAAGLALLAMPRHAKVVAAAVRAAAFVLLVAVLERFSNHGVLLFLIAFFLTLAPPAPSAPSFDASAHPALGLVRAQLVVVYVFSALNKLAAGFTSGASLSNLLGPALPQGSARALSWLVVVTELAVPLVLLRAPRAGIVLAVLLHAGFAVLVPGVASFGLAMIAMAVLFAGVPPPAYRGSARGASTRGASKKR